MPEMVAAAIWTAACHGASRPVDYAIEVMSEWIRNEVRTIEQVDEYSRDYIGGMLDHDLQYAQDAIERRRRENVEKGLLMRATS